MNDKTFIKVLVGVIILLMVVLVGKLVIDNNLNKNMDDNNDASDLVISEQKTTETTQENKKTTSQNTDTNKKEENTYDEKVTNRSINLLEYINKYLYIIIIAILILYILFALGLSNIAYNEGYNSILAWIPIANIYLLAKVGFNDSKVKWGVLGMIFISGTVTTNVNGEQTVHTILPNPINTIISIALAIFLLVALYNIYDKKSDHAIIMTVLTVLSGGILAPIFLYAIRNR